MKEEAGEVGGVGAAVAFVAKEGVADLGKLAANLVLAAAVQADLQERRRAVTRQGAHVGAGVLQLALGRNQSLQRLLSAHLSLNQGKIGLFNLVVHEEFAEGAAGRLPFAEEEGTAGFKIETMHRGDGEAVAAVLEEFLTAGGEIVSFMPFTGVDRQPRRFGDDEEIAGFEKDLQGRHRQQIAQALALGEEDAGAYRQTGFSVEDLLSAANLPLAQELPQITRRSQGDTALQQHQQGEMFLPLLDGEGKGWRRRFVHFGIRARR